MVVTREDGHESLSLDERRHKRDVGAAVLTVVSSAVANVALVSYVLFVKAWTRLPVTPVLLKRSRCTNRNMHKSHTGDRTAVLLGKRVVGIAKPFDDLQESVQRITW